MLAEIEVILAELEAEEAGHHLRHRILRRRRDQHVHMIRHQVARPKTSGQELPGFRNFLAMIG